MFSVEKLKLMRIGTHFAASETDLTENKSLKGQKKSSLLLSDDFVEGVNASSLKGCKSFFLIRNNALGTPESGDTESLNVCR